MRKAIPCTILPDRYWEPCYQKSYTLSGTEDTHLVMASSYRGPYIAVLWDGDKEVEYPNLQLVEAMRLIETLVATGAY